MNNIYLLKHVTKHTFLVDLFAEYQKSRTFASCFS